MHWPWVPQNKFIFTNVLSFLLEEIEGVYVTRILFILDQNTSELKETYLIGFSLSFLGNATAIHILLWH